MIYQLLQNLVNLLRAELQDLVSQPEASIGVGISPSLATASLPYFLFSPGGWGLSQNARDMGSRNLIVREFQQEFALYISAQSFPVVEQYSSLVTGILLNSHDTLIQQFNAPQAPSAATAYRSKQFATTHSLSGFKFLQATYLTADLTSQSAGTPRTRSLNQTAPDPITVQLNWVAVGSIEMTQTTTEGDRLIERVNISVARSPNL